MYKYRKKIVSLFAVMIVLFSQNVFAENQVYRLSSKSLSDKLQIAMDIEKRPRFKVFSLSHPLRLVVDIKAQVSTSYENDLNFKRRGVRTVRTAMQDRDTIRLVLELNKNYRWKAYSVPADGTHRYPRLLIDVYDRKHTSHSTVAKSQKKPKNSAIVLESFNKQGAKQIQQPITKKSTAKVAKVEKPKKPLVLEVEKDIATNTDKPQKKLGQKSVTKPVVVKKVAKPATPITPKTAKTKPAKIPGEMFAKTDKPKVSPKPAKIPAEMFGTTDSPQATPTIRRPKSGKLIVVIDAGHGGKDSGALGKYGTQEKMVVLQIAKKLKIKIDAIPGMRAILTRGNDRYISLRGRLRLARKYKADLFVSIHADAARNRSAQGSSVYILSNRGASSESARWLARRENAVDLKYGVDIGDYDKDVSNMLMQIQQDATIESSHRLANKTLQRLRSVGKLHKSHVERAGFAVLKSPDIPSMLVETAFISNPVEEKNLKSSWYQNKLANAVASGIRSYFGK
ncbi:MAG: N-acetylmuramoyl-L-alanine amidase [Gammaproteobacteria bacterium]|nr:N-acetylmuramoyl-L-alanine amidase [Gammaproteobacteria bacterium]